MISQLKLNTPTQISGLKVMNFFPRELPGALAFDFSREIQTHTHVFTLFRSNSLRKKPTYCQYTSCNANHAHPLYGSPCHSSPQTDKKILNTKKSLFFRFFGVCHLNWWNFGSNVQNRKKSIRKIFCGTFLILH